MDQKTLKTLEYAKVLSKIQHFAVSSYPKELIMSLTPYENESEIKTALGEVLEAYDIKYVFGLNPIEEFDDCLDICQKAVKGATLTPGDLLKIKSLLRSGRIAQTVLSPMDCPLLQNYTQNYFADKILEDDIDRCILSEIDISDNASSTLKDIRRKIADKKSALKEKLSSYFRKSEFSKYMQDNIVTVRNDRFVLPVKSEYRSSVPGLIHDISSSGATVFIEPFAVVETNNEIKSLALKEAAEIEKILSDLSVRVADLNDDLIKMQKAVAALDIIFAKTMYSAEINGTAPKFNKRGIVNLKNARHPLIDKMNVVPVSIAVGNDYRILMITGPNTGGKTVCLKTVGLLCLMAYTGLLIPCDEGSEVAIYDNIFCDIGDDQSITESLSTFSSHIVNLIKITEDMTADTLLLLDELGGGTDPQEGAALAIGIIKYIEMWKSTAIITTHYGELKEYALLSADILNASMQFDSETLKPTYKLMMGIPGTSNAINIAKTLGLNDKILNFALESMDQEKIGLENLIKSAESVKKKSEEELEQTERIKEDLLLQKAKLIADQNLLTEKLDKINFSAKSEIKKMVSAGVEKAEELIEQLKEKVKIGNERALLEARSIKKQLENIEYEMAKEESPVYEDADIDKLKIGDKVFIKSLNSIGTLAGLRDKKDEVTVLLGSIKTKVKTDELAKPVIVEKPKPKQRPHEYKPSPKSDFAVVPEINVIGYTVSEAVEIIEPYLINAANSDESKMLRIVHGKGTGALGKGIQQFLRSLPYVRSYRYGGYGEGERGVTIVELKEQ